MLSNYESENFFPGAGNLETERCPFHGQFHPRNYVCPEKRIDRDLKELEPEVETLLTAESMLAAAGEQVIFEPERAEKKRKFLKALVREDFMQRIQDPKVQKDSNKLTESWFDVTQTIAQQEGAAPYVNVGEEVAFFAGMTSTVLKKDPVWIYMGINNGIKFRQNETADLETRLSRLTGKTELDDDSREHTRDMVRAERQRRVDMYMKGLIGTNHDIDAERIGMQFGYKLAVKIEQQGKKR